MRIRVTFDEVLEAEVSKPLESEGVPIVAVEALVFLKVKEHRQRDRKDLVQLLRNGVDAKPIREFLQHMAPQLLERFDVLVEEAEQEE